MQRSSRKLQRNIAYVLKLVLLFTVIFIYSLQIQSYGGIRIEPEFVESNTSLLVYEEIVTLQYENIEDKEEVKFYDVPEGLFTDEDQRYAYKICNDYNVPFEIVLSIIQRESNFDSFAIGDNGESFGYMQIMKKWHEDRMERLGVENLLKPKENILVGVDYLAELIEKYPEMNRALMAYNCGPTQAKKLWEQGIFQTKYTIEVMTDAEVILNKITFD